MTEGLLQALVNEDFGYRKEGKDWGRAEQHSSLVVNEKEQKWYWNSEQKGGDVLAYLLHVRGLDKKKAQEILKLRNSFLSGYTEEEKGPQEFVPYEKLVELMWSMGKTERDYWYTRKLTDETIDRFRLGHYDGWNLIPLYIGDKFVNFQCRRDIPEKRIKMWYKIEGWKPVLVNQEILNLVDTIYITEGPVDAILLNQEGLPAVSHTGGAGYWNPEWFPLFHRMKNIFYICDNDASGQAAGKKVAASLGYDRVRLFTFKDTPEKYDTGDYFKGGGNAKELKDMIAQEAKNFFEIGDINYNGKRKGYPAFRRGNGESKKRSDDNVFCVI